MDPNQLEELKATLWDFMHNHIYPNEEIFLRQSKAIGARSNEWTRAPILTELQKTAKSMVLTPFKPFNITLITFYLHMFGH